MIYLQDADCTLHQGDALEVLRGLPAESVHMCCTSPPFYGLRDYGTGTWEGGNAECDHTRPPNAPDPSSTLQNAGRNTHQNHSREPWPANVCGKCGARRVDQQIGLEATPDEWVARLVEVFREVRRVLRSDGTLWVEIGDSYNSGTTGQRPSSTSNHGHWQKGGQMGDSRLNVPGLKTKDLGGFPWLLAFALRADGWYLRSEIIWAKPNPMPESVTDRPTVSHSRVFLFAKQPRYFYDAEAIREPLPPGAKIATGAWDGPSGGLHNGRAGVKPDGGVTHPNGRNRRTVWTIPTQPYPEAHFATWPEKLVEPMILAGTSERGVCPECGAPWERIVESELVKSPVHGAGSVVRGRGEGDDVNGWAGESYPRLNHQTTTLGWQPTCECAPSEPDILDYGGDLNAHAGAYLEWQHLLTPVFAVVLDPFAGSGTTLHVARRMGRRSIGIELSADYCQLAADRLAQQSLLTGGAA